MLPLNDPGQTKKVLGMLFSSRMRFYCVRLWLCPKHFHFLLFCFWTRRTFLLFFNKQTNKRTSKQCLISGQLYPHSSVQCSYHPQQEIELKIPRGQPNASQSKDHSVLLRSPLFCIEDSEKALPEQLKTFQESFLFLSTPACPLLLKACQRVWWGPGQNC